MTLVIGTDEAGYGPNLGPLVVAASLWRLDAGDGATASDGAERRLAALADAVAGDAGETVWGDSKALYSPGGGVGALERGVLAALGACGGVPADGAALLTRLGAGLDRADRAVASAPEWPALLATRLPVATAADTITALAAAAAARGAAARVALVAVAARVVTPSDFNAALDEGLNKSDLLSRTTLDLAASLRAAAPAEEALVWCDRHGGRKAYAGLVARHFDTTLPQVLEETARRSRYRIAAAGGVAPAEVDFSVGGEARLPVALASMTAKYLRELSMEAFNAHWCGALPGLRPTAGYPVDARRWLDDAAPALRGAGLPDGAVWRRA